MSNEEILELNLTPNQYFLAEIIHNKRKDLFEKLLTIENEDKIKNDLYKLYIKSYLNCEYCELYNFDFDKLKVENLFVNQTKTKDNINTFAKELYDIFPEKVTTGNLNVKSDFKGFTLKIDKFIKENKLYDKDIIKKAFTLYVNRCKSKNYQYMKQIGYFIYKNNDSVLGGICEEIINNPKIDVNGESRESTTFTTI